jgi:RNA polymerase sigma-70 factor (ECF subfamily)
VTDLARSSQLSPVRPARDATSAPAAPAGKLDFSDLFSKELDYVWFTLRRLGVPARDLEDVAHDVFMHVHKHLAEYDPRRPIRAWLFGFAYREASDYRRLARHRVEQLDGEMDIADRSPSAAEQVEQRQMLDIAWRALADLELERRAVFILHEVEGIPAPEIAETLKIPLNTAYSRLRLARKQFSRSLARSRLRRGEP